MSALTVIGCSFSCYLRRRARKVAVDPSLHMAYVGCLVRRRKVGLRPARENVLEPWGIGKRVSITFQTLIRCFRCPQA